MLSAHVGTISVKPFMKIFPYFEVNFVEKSAVGSVRMEIQ
jgi:hypothetical protein